MQMQLLKATGVSFALTLLTTSVFSQIDTVKTTNKLLNSANLRVGLTKYLVYSEDTLTHVKTGMSIWERVVTKEKYNNTNAILIKQHWIMLDTNNTQRAIVSYLDAKTFNPISHESVMTASKGRRLAEHFIFNKESIVGDAKANNKDFILKLDGPTFNWELDMETFAQLPLKNGKSFAINFYHPGSKVKPAFYIYTVEGEELLYGVNNQKYNCWKLINRDGKSENYTIWWINKKNHTVVKMKEIFNGKIRYKLLMQV